ncbi:hypothetical protein M426DRAFT_161519 [Hypoxylon sp. CI-4A]|nr:hypothetical protein M426DRAFT_161519 [Hypoxylon sp. CI-4A]
MVHTAYTPHLTQVSFLNSSAPRFNLMKAPLSSLLTLPHVHNVDIRRMCFDTQCPWR